MGSSKHASELKRTFSVVFKGERESPPWTDRDNREGLINAHTDTSVLQVDPDPDPDTCFKTFWEFATFVACFLLHPHNSDNLTLQIYQRGGALAIAYSVCMVLLGWPLLLYEATLGGCTSTHPLYAFRFCPLLEGIGYGMMMYVIVLLAFENITVGGATFFSVVAMMIPRYTDLVNATVYDPLIEDDVGVPAVYYLYHVYVGSQHFLHGTGLGEFRVYLMLGMVFSWIMLFIASIGKATYYCKVVLLCVLVPLQLFMIMILMAVLQRPGALQSVGQFFGPTTDFNFEMAAWAMLLTVQSLTTGTGVVVHLASLARIKWPSKPCWAVAMVVAVIFKEMSFAVLTAASLGTYAAAHNATIHDYLHMEIMGLYQKVLFLALDYLSFSEFWRIFVFLFFWMAECYYSLILLRCLVAAVRPLPFVRRLPFPRLWAAAGLSLAFLSFGCFCCFRNTAGYGMAWELQQPKWAQIMLCLLEMVAGVYCFGFRALLLVIKDSLGYFPDIYLRLCWIFLPLLILGALLTSLNATADRRLDANRLLCVRMNCWEGLILMVAVLVPVVIIGFNNIRIYTLRQTLASVLRPQRDVEESSSPGGSSVNADAGEDDSPDGASRAASLHSLASFLASRERYHQHRDQQKELKQ